jgi:ABC-type Fe3+-hydroxamate transport system substrate-binding protein
VAELIVQDALGREHRLQRSPRRIVSLVPSLTETLFQLGCGERVVGVTDYCVHPARGVAVCAKVGGTKNPSLERIRALWPDLVIANKEENRRQTVAALEEHGIPVFVTYARTVHGALEEIATLGRITGCASQAQAIVERIEDSWVLARARVAEPRPRVAALVWKGPYMVVGSDTFADALLYECGSQNPFAEHPGRYPRVEEADLERAAPQVILLPTEPYAFGESDRAELSRLDCPAAHASRIHVVEGELLSWYGPRMARALDLLSRLLAAA